MKIYIVTLFSRYREGGETIMDKKHGSPQESAEDEARRQFLARCGRFAAVTPPAMALLVSVAAAPDEARASMITGKDKNKDKNKNK